MVGSIALSFTCIIMRDKFSSQVALPHEAGFSLYDNPYTDTVTKGFSKFVRTMKFLTILWDIGMKSSLEHTSMGVGLIT